MDSIVALHEKDSKSQLAAKQKSKKTSIQDIVFQSKTSNPTNTVTNRQPDANLEHETLLEPLFRSDGTWKPICKCGNKLSPKFWCDKCSSFCVTKGNHPRDVLTVHRGGKKMSESGNGSLKLGKTTSSSKVTSKQEISTTKG